MPRRIGFWTLLVALSIAAWAPAWAQTGLVMPTPRQQFFTNDGDPCDGCLVYTWEAGTSTPATVYQDVTLMTAHANPIELDSAGRATVYLPDDDFKFTLHDATDVLIWEVDNVRAQPSLTEVSDVDDLIFQVDTDNNGTNVFSFLDGSGTQRLQLDESGDVQMDGDLVVSGAGPHAVGTTTLDYASLLISPTFTSGGASTTTLGVSVEPKLTLHSADNTGYHLAVAALGTASLTTPGVSATISDVATLVLTEPNITVGSGDTVTRASTVHIANAPTEATNNYALFVADGAIGGAFWDVQWGPGAGMPPASNPATLDTRNAILVLDFDATTDESVVFGGVLPPQYAGGGVVVTLHWMATSATSAEAIWCAQIERGTTDLDADSFATAVCSEAVTTSSTSGILTATGLTFTDGAAMDSLAAGEAFRLKVYRDANDGDDDMAGDGELVRVILQEN